jgi:non-ribosomal peptide synthase protein (TIGR01720 family)
MEGHGRTDLLPDIDVSRTVGWFTTFWPVRFELKKDPLPTEVLQTVREQLRAIPGDGLGYGVLRYLTADQGLTRELTSSPAPEIVFNYLGHQRASRGGNLRLRPRDGIFGVTRDPHAHRPSLLEISGRVVDDQLELACIYSRNVHHLETMTHLLHRATETVISLVDTPLREGGRLASASDFPDAGLSQDELNTLIDPT